MRSIEINRVAAAPICLMGHAAAAQIGNYENAAAVLHPPAELPPGQYAARAPVRPRA